ncbi:MAG: AAA family ATPase [Coprococcus comes]
MHSYYKEHTSGQNFQYVDTPLVEAIRYGYILEIQEPTVIANPGVLVGLNSLLDRCNSVYLPNGETIHRHPDTTIVITTNNDYAGCKQMNQSVISRMNLVIDLDEPDEDTQVERAMAVTGCKDAKTVRLMTRIVKSMAVYCRENLITDGCCGMRELISWVQSYMVCGDIRESARYTVLASASADAENRTEVEESCLDTVLAA